MLQSAALIDNCLFFLLLFFSPSLVLSLSVCVWLVSRLTYFILMWEMFWVSYINFNTNEEKQLNLKSVHSLLQKLILAPDFDFSLVFVWKSRLLFLIPAHRHAAVCSLQSREPFRRWFTHLFTTTTPLCLSLAWYGLSVVCLHVSLSG